MTNGLHPVQPKLEAYTSSSVLNNGEQVINGALTVNVKMTARSSVQDRLSKTLKIQRYGEIRDGHILAAFLLGNRPGVTSPCPA